MYGECLPGQQLKVFHYEEGWGRPFPEVQVRCGGLWCIFKDFCLQVGQSLLNSVQNNVVSLLFLVWEG